MPRRSSWRNASSASSSSTVADKPSLSKDDLRVFAERGYILVPNAIPEPCRHFALARIDELLAETSPPAGHRGYHFHWVMHPAPSEPLMALLHAPATQEAVRALIAPLTIDQPDHIQVAVNIPVWPHRPGGPHLDGLTPPEPSGRPGTFTVLAAMLLTDQTADDMGNLWVWPGSHHVAADYLRRHGPEAILGIAHPTYPMAPPEQVKGRAGDLLLAHYLLGHNIGGNTSDQVRRVVYFRLHAEGHRQRWRDCVRDPLLEFASVRTAASAGKS